MLDTFNRVFKPIVKELDYMSDNRDKTSAWVKFSSQSLSSKKLRSRGWRISATRSSTGP